MIVAIGTMVLYALIVGFIAAGFVWYGWGLTQNVHALRTAAAARKALEKASGDSSEDSRAGA